MKPYRQILDTLRESSNLSHSSLWILHLQKRQVIPVYNPETDLQIVNSGGSAISWYDAGGEGLRQKQISKFFKKHSLVSTTAQ